MRHFNSKNGSFSYTGWFTVKIPLKNSGDYIRSRHQAPNEFRPNSLTAITLFEEQGIKANLFPQGRNNLKQRK